MRLSKKLDTLLRMLNSSSVKDSASLETVVNRLGELAKVDSIVFELASSPMDQDLKGTLLAEMSNLEGQISEALKPTIHKGFLEAFVRGEELDRHVKIEFPLLMNEGVAGMVALFELRAEVNTMSSAVVQAVNAPAGKELEPVRQRFATASAAASAALSSVLSNSGMADISAQLEEMKNTGRVPQMHLIYVRGS